MSSSKFIEVIQPVVNGVNVGFVPSNVKKANRAAGLTEHFGISLDAPTSSEWVNPTMFIAVLTDAIKKQQELNVRQEEIITSLSDAVKKQLEVNARQEEVVAELRGRVVGLEFLVSRNAQYIDGFNELFKEVTIAEPSVIEQSVQEQTIQEPVVQEPSAQEVEQTPKPIEGQ